MKILLDTHILLFLATGDKKLTRSAKKGIEQSEVILLSSISTWEIFMLIDRGHIKLNKNPLTWFYDVVEEYSIRVIDVSTEISQEAVSLKWAHKDPADRWIVATALKEKAQLVTNDRAIIASKLLKCIH